MLALYSRPSQPAIFRRGWGFHTLRGGVDLGDLVFFKQFVGRFNMSKHLRSGDANVTSPAGARFFLDAGVSMPCGVVLTLGVNIIYYAGWLQF